MAWFYSPSLPPSLLPICVCNELFFLQPVSVAELPSSLLHHQGPASPSSGPLSPLSSSPRGEGSISSLSTTPSCLGKILIPEYWREETQECIDNKVMDDESRSDITRTLVTLLTAKYGTRPRKNHCQDLARQLIHTGQNIEFRALYVVQVIPRTDQCQLSCICVVSNMPFTLYYVL